MLTLLLAQTDSISATFSDIFWMSIGLIFLAAIVGAIVAQRRRDRCLKLIDDYHITLQTTAGRCIWGDLRVYAKGVEVIYDAPYMTAQGLVKSSYMLYDEELANVLAISRYVGGLTDDELRTRARQVEARFHPAAWRRSIRWFRNMFNTVRDAGAKALGAVIGQFAKARPGTVVSQSSAEVNQIGQTIISNVGYAYEPMLEKHIGTPVVLELASPSDPAKRTIELPGYLAEYSDRYVAVFNVDQPVHERIELSGDAALEREDLTIASDERAATVTNKADTPLVIESVATGDVTRELNVVLTNGASARLSRGADVGAMTLHLVRVRQIDIVCPRQHARVRHASSPRNPRKGPPSLPPAHEDRSVAFP